MNNINLDIKGFEYNNALMEQEENELIGAINQKIADKLAELYPEIKIKYTNEPITYKENTFNQEQLNNEVKFRLKVVDALFNISKDRKVIKAASKEKPYIELNLRKYLAGQGISNNQINFIFDYMNNNNIKIIDTVQLAMDIAANYSYAIEANTAKHISALNSQKVTEQSSKEEFDSINVKVDFTGDPMNPTYEKVTNDYIYELEQDPETGEETYSKYSKEKATQNAQYYSDLTVLGGTNYTENEIKTPNITPNIKGHAEFSTDQGIGWFRSDEQISRKIPSIIPSDEELMKEYKKGYNGHPFPFSFEEHKKYRLSNIEKEGNYESSKTRRILELQSDLFQKGKNKERLVKESEKTRKLNKLNIDSYIKGDYFYISRSYGYAKKHIDSNRYTEITKEEFETNIPKKKY